MPLFVIASAATALAIIALSVMLTQRFAGSPWLSPFLSTGRMSLTLYVAHVVVGMGVLKAIGRLENQTLNFAVVGTISFCACGFFFAHMWLKRFKHGPLEALMRRVTG